MSYRINLVLYKELLRHVVNYFVLFGSEAIRLMHRPIEEALKQVSVLASTHLASTSRVHSLVEAISPVGLINTPDASLLQLSGFAILSFLSLNKSFDLLSFSQSVRFASLGLLSQPFLFIEILLPQIHLTVVPATPARLLPLSPLTVRLLSSPYH